VKLADCTIIPVTFIFYFFLISGNLLCAVVIRLTLACFSACSSAFCRASAQKTPQSSMPSPSFNRTERVKRPRGDRSRHSPKETVKRNDFTIQKKKKKKHKECVTLEQTEQIQIKHVRNEKTNKEKQTNKTRLGSWRSALVISGDL